MIEHKTYTATIDRIEDGIAVILLEDDGETVGERYIHNLERIPSDGRHDGAVLRVTIDDDEISAITYDQEAEQARRERIQKRFDKLSKRPPNADSDKSK